MNIKNEHLVDKEDFAIFVKDKHGKTFYVTIQEGTGDNLLNEDMEEGFIDYANYECYKNSNGTLTADDGGCVLLTEYYKDMSVEDIVSLVVDDIECDAATILALPNSVNTTFFEDIADEKIDELDSDSASTYDAMLLYIQKETKN